MRRYDSYKRRNMREDIRDAEKLRNWKTHAKANMDTLIEDVKLTAFEYFDAVLSLEDADRYAYEMTNLFAILRNAVTDMEQGINDL